MVPTPSPSPPRIHRLLCLFVLLCGLFNQSHSQAADLSGQVVAVPSAKQIILQTDQGRRLRITLIGITTPADRGTWADIGKRHLHMLLAGRFVTVEAVTHSPGGVILGRVLHGGADIGLRLLQSGLAEAAASNLDPTLRQKYQQAEQTARSRRMGYWQTNR